MQYGNYFLGTNGWYDSVTGNAVSVPIKLSQYNIVIDAGFGMAKLDHYTSHDDDKPVYIFLSHFHLDNICGLHSLAKFNFKNTLTICGPPESKKILSTVIAAPFTMPFSDLPYLVQIKDLPLAAAQLPFVVDALPLLHPPPPTLGYRIFVDGKIITFCIDTGYYENAIVLAKDADILITECAFKSGQTSEGWPHLNPELAAQMAQAANVKQLALFHFDAFAYQTTAERYEAFNVAKNIFPNTTAVEDGTIITL